MAKRERINNPLAELQSMVGRRGDSRGAVARAIIPEALRGLVAKTHPESVAEELISPPAKTIGKKTRSQISS